jgi:signal transduction histidine kinase
MKRQVAMSALETGSRAAQVYDALPSPVVLTNAGGQIVDLNPAARAFFGRQVRFAGRPIRDLLPMVADGPDDESTWHGPATDARNQTVDVEVVRSRIDEGALAGHDLYVLHNVSKFIELNRLREQLLYNVAHELRGPVGVLENVLEILADDYATLTLDEADHLLRSGRRTAVRLHDLMEDLLCAGSIQAGRFLAQPRPVPVLELVDDGVEAIRSVLNDRSQSVEVVSPPVDLMVYADAHHAGRVVANLLSNAAKYGPESEAIVVEIEGQGDQVRVSVHDQGPGIPADQQSGLFERFYRVRARNEAPGIGLGLAIAHGIIEAHGGSMGIESAPGQGTTVWFTLPAADERR